MKAKFLIGSILLILFAFSLTLATEATITITRIKGAAPSLSITPMGILTKPEIGLDTNIVVSMQFENPSGDLDGFLVKLILQDPDGVNKTPVTFKYKRSTYAIKGSWGTSFSIDSKVIADKKGTWTAYAEAYTYDGSTFLDSDYKEFDVVKEPPKAYIEITNIAGYTALATAIITAIALARTFR